jgi:hypothetical protein
MTITTILIISGIVSAFLLFGGVLAWGDFYSRNARHNDQGAPAQPVPASQSADAYRKAA